MKKVNVAVAVIINSNSEILIAKRHQHLHQGGKWEFPGGKIEADESVETAIVRELKEEVALDVHSVLPMMVLDFDYGDKQVTLHICKVVNFSGQALGAEQQEIRWIAVSDLNNYQFPEANQPIIDSLIAEY